jgi:hypothetical protein
MPCMKYKLENGSKNGPLDITEVGSGAEEE